MSKLQTTIAQGRRRQQVNCKYCDGLDWCQACEASGKLDKAREKYLIKRSEVIGSISSGTFIPLGGEIDENTKKSKPL